MGCFLEYVNIFPKSFLLLEIKHTSCIYHTIMLTETKVKSIDGGKNDKKDYPD